MTVLKIKNEVLRLIVDTDDVEVLTKVRDFVNEIQKTNTYTLTKEQIELLEKSKEDVREGRVYTRQEAKAKNKAFIESKKQGE